MDPVTAGLAAQGVGSVFGAFGAAAENKKKEKAYKELLAMIDQYRGKEYIDPQATMAAYDQAQVPIWQKTLEPLQRRFGWDSGRAVGAAISQTAPDYMQKLARLFELQGESRQQRDQSYLANRTAAYGARYGG